VYMPWSEVGVEFLPSVRLFLKKYAFGVRGHSTSAIWSVRPIYDVDSMIFNVRFIS
jgi:hypothetical protein